MTSLPKFLQYRNIKPRGFSQQYRKLWINPQMSFQDYRTNEQVKFLIQEGAGYIDPYTLYFDITVEAKASDLGAAGL